MVMDDTDHDLTGYLAFGPAPHRSAHKTNKGSWFAIDPMAPSSSLERALPISTAATAAEQAFSVRGSVGGYAPKTAIPGTLIRCWSRAAGLPTVLRHGITAMVALSANQRESAPSKKHNRAKRLARN